MNFHINLNIWNYLNSLGCGLEFISEKLFYWLCLTVKAPLLGGGGVTAPLNYTVHLWCCLYAGRAAVYISCSAVCSSSWYSEPVIAKQGKLWLWLLIRPRRYHAHLHPRWIYSTMPRYCSCGIEIYDIHLDVNCDHSLNEQCYYVSLPRGHIITLHSVHLSVSLSVLTLRFSQKGKAVEICNLEET